MNQEREGERPNWTSQEVSDRLDDLFGEEPPADELQQAYREAASVLATFSSETLNPVGGSGEPNPKAALANVLDAAEPAAGQLAESSWTLTAEARRRALKTLLAEGRVEQALNANPSRARGQLQQTLESYLLGRPVNLNSTDPTGLQAILKVSDWLQGIISVPDLQTVQHRLEQETLLKPFRDLVGSEFAGREKEMNDLTDYVGVYEASSFSESVRRGAASFVGSVKRDPLFIRAMGGLGKSTLIAQFILTHAAAQYIDRFPFAYLDFDRPGLLVEEPVTLLVEVIRQIGIQYPEAAHEVAQVRAQWSKRIQESHSVELDSMRRKIFRVRNRGWYYKSFASLVNSIKTPGKAVLLVLDTFEEVQYRSGAFVEEVFEFLAALQDLIPELRTVLAGRAPVKSKRLSVTTMLLPPFDKPAARAFLMKQGVADHGLAVTVADQVGGSPLTLKLAARFLSVARPDEVDSSGIRLERGVLDRIIGESIDALLYSRILDHIRDLEVRALAHPGLILRRITADLILKVLAGPCEVKVSNRTQAEDLFNRFSREITLVDVPEAGVLEHRQDVRSVMVGLMLKKDPSRSRQIGDLAVEYYAEKSDQPARGEELYHRLLFGDYRREEVESRLELEPVPSGSLREGADRIRGWVARQMSSAPLRFVQRSIQELPDRSKAFVAAHTNSELEDPNIWKKEADLEDWELRTARLALDCIAIGKPSGANEFLRERRERTASSPLYAIDLYSCLIANDSKATMEAWGRFLEAAKKLPPSSFVLDALFWAPEVAAKTTKLGELAPLMDFVFFTRAFDEGLPTLLTTYMDRYQTPSDQELIQRWINIARVEQWPELNLVPNPRFSSKNLSSPNLPRQASYSSHDRYNKTDTITSMQPGASQLNQVKFLIETHKSDLQVPGVIDIQPGYKLVNNWPSKEPAIVVTKSKEAAAPALPSQIEGVAVDVRDATDVEELRHQEPDRYAQLAAEHGELQTGAFAEAGAATAVAPEVLAKPQVPYTPPDTPLKAVSGNLTFTCHASPDAGWPTLKAFLSKTQSRLTVGLYDFTSEHILDGVQSSLATGQSLEITLDNPARNPTADQSDTETLEALSKDLGESLTAAWAPVRSNKALTQWIFPTAYHIKVAVRDGKSVWLSSGNWNNSNQPDMDPINDPQPTDQATAKKSDRDWHVVIDNEDLAAQYELYLKNDNEVAKSLQPDGPGTMALETPEMMPPFELEAKPITFQFHAPLQLTDQEGTITPLLTPDQGVYQPAMLGLINSAESKLYIQLQYIHPSDKDEDAGFTALVDAVAQKIKAGVDVRIICSQFQASNNWLDRLQAAGIDLGFVKIQNGVHNKGFVVDSKKVALGSQNWSGDGVLRNRDASVIIDNGQAASYFEQIFLHDWNNVARQSVK